MHGDFPGRVVLVLTQLGRKLERAMRARGIPEQESISISTDRTDRTDRQPLVLVLVLVLLLLLLLAASSCTCTFLGRARGRPKRYQLSRAGFPIRIRRGSRRGRGGVFDLPFLGGILQIYRFSRPKRLQKTAPMYLQSPLPIILCALCDLCGSPPHPHREIFGCANGVFGRALAPKTARWVEGGGSVIVRRGWRGLRPVIRRPV